MNYINCPSYDPLFFALYLKDKGKDIFIITRNHDVQKYCEFTNISSIFLTQPVLSIKTLGSLFSFKKEADDFFNGLNLSPEDRFYFFGNEHTIEGFYLAKLFSEKCEVLNPCILNFKEYTGQLFNFDGIKHQIGRKIFKQHLGIDLIFKDWKKHVAYGIDEDFIFKHNIVKFDCDYFQTIKSGVIKNNQIKLKQYDNLIDGGMFICEGVIKESSLKEVSNFFSSSMDSFVVKNHPFFKPNSNYLKGCEEYPTFIPIEFLFGNIKKNFIAIYCQALKSASQFPHIKAISLLEMVEWESKEFKQEIKAILLEGTPNIIFPKTYKELGELLK